MTKYDNKMGPFEGNRSGLGRALRLVLGTGLALSAIGCGSSPAPKARTAASAEGAKRPARWGARRPSTTRSARRAPPSSSPRRRSAPSPRTSAPSSRRRCSATHRPRSRVASRAPSAAASRRPSSRSPTATPAFPRRDSIRAPCWPSAAGKRTRSGSGRGRPPTDRPSPTAATWPGSGASRRRPSRFSIKRSRTTLCTRSRRATTWRRFCATRPAAPRALTRRRGTSRRRSATCAPSSRSTATTCRRSRRWRSSTTT